MFVVGNGQYRGGRVSTSSYSEDTLYACVQMYSGSGDWRFCATRYGYTSHYHTLSSHTHNVTLADHMHSVALSDHSHSVSISSHTHNVTLADHIHALQYGIYESSMPATVRVYLDGTLLTALNDVNDLSDYDLLPYIRKDSNGRVAEGWHELQWKSATSGATGRVQGTVFARKFISTEAT